MTLSPFYHFTGGGDIRHGLPGVAYTSEEFYAQENERVFGRGWVFVGFAHDMPRRGDVVPVTVAGRPVVLVRDEGEEVVAFHNVCRHRCLQLVAQAGNVGRLIRCPYHSWSYGLDGALRGTPFFGGMEEHVPAGFEVAENGLVRVRCAVWHDWVFVNLDGEGPRFEDYIKPLAERLARWDLAMLMPVAMLDFGVVKANWKLLMENFIEPYHVQFVHSTTTEQPLADHSAFIDRHCLGSSVVLPADKQGGNDERGGGGTLAVDSHYLTLFPNFVLATYAPDQLGVHLNCAVGVGRTRQRRAIYLLRDGEVSDAEVARLEGLWRQVHAEDHAMCERLQVGRRSPVAAGGGWMSPKWETSARRFQELVYDAVVGEAAGEVVSPCSDSINSEGEL